MRRRPRIPYLRPVRDRILAKARNECRLPTAEERRELFAESWCLSKAGYHIARIHDEDEAELERLREELKAGRRRRRCGAVEASGAEHEVAKRSVRNETDATSAAAAGRRRRLQRDEALDQTRRAAGRVSRFLF